MILEFSSFIEQLAALLELIDTLETDGLMRVPRLPSVHSLSFGILRMIISIYHLQPRVLDTGKAFQKLVR